METGFINKNKIKNAEGVIALLFGDRNSGLWKKYEKENLSRFLLAMKNLPTSFPGWRIMVPVQQPGQFFLFSFLRAVKGMVWQVFLPGSIGWRREAWSRELSFWFRPFSFSVPRF
jgi:hypothetical protein